MNKRQLWATLKEITRRVDDWDEKSWDINKLTFAKFLPAKGDWNKLEKYLIKIVIEKVEMDEEEDDTRKSSQSA